MSTRKTSKKPSRSDQTSFNESGLWEKIKRMNKDIHYMRQNSKKQGFSIPEMPPMRAYPRYYYEMPHRATRKPAKLAVIESPAEGPRKYKKTTKREKRRRRTQRRKKPKKTKKRR